MNLWNTLLIRPLAALLLLLYSLTGNNLGLAIIALTVLLRLLLIPLSLPAFRSVKIQQELKPKLDKLRKKYKGDTRKFAQAQLELFRQAGVNPFAGCLPQILQLLILIALYNVLINTLSDGELDTKFLIWDLALPDPYFILPVLAAVAQFLLARLMRPAVAGGEKVAGATEEKTDDIAVTMQKQNLYLFPLLTLFIGAKLSSGLMLYWFISSVLQLGQQWWLMRVRGSGDSKREEMGVESKRQKRRRCAKV